MFGDATVQKSIVPFRCAGLGGAKARFPRLNTRLESQTEGEKGVLISYL